MTDETRFLNKTFLLKSDPFKEREARASEKELEYWVNRTDELKKIKDFIDQSLNKDENSFIMIRGGNGDGKSMIILKTEKEILSEENYRDFIVTNMNFMGTLVPKNTLDIYLRIFLSLLEKIRSQEVLRTKFIGEIKKLDTDAFNNFIQSARFYLAKEGDGDVYSLYTHAVANKYFEGRSLTKSERFDIEIYDSLRTESEAQKVLAGFLIALKKCDLKRLLIFVDELEYLFALMPRAKQSQFIAFLRSLYDFPEGSTHSALSISMARIVMIMSISIEGYRALDLIDQQERDTSGGPVQALLRRMEGPLDLNRFKESDIKDLIKVTLEKERTKKGLNKYNPPFEDDFVKFLSSKTGGNPSKIVRLCKSVMSSALLDQPKTITKEYAESVLRLEQVESTLS